jgi:hypothetical protein
MRIEQQYIDPALAEAYFALNHKNKKINEYDVARLASDILAGRFYLHHQGIAFDDKGRLRDGQHRLLAIIRANRGVWMMVAYGLSDEAVSAIDQQRGRTLADTMRIVDDVSISAAESATANQMSRAGAPSLRPSSLNAARAFFKQHELAIRYATKLLSRGGKGVDIAPVRSVFGRAYYHLSSATLERAAAVLAGGLPKQEEATMMHFRGFLKDMVGASNGTINAEIYWKTERALKAFSVGEVLTRIYAATSEQFPLPEGKGLLG